MLQKGGVSLLGGGVNFSGGLGPRRTLRWITTHLVKPCISLLSTELNVKGGECFLNRSKWCENNNFRDSKDLFLKYVEELQELVTKLWVGLVNEKSLNVNMKHQIVLSLKKNMLAMLNNRTFKNIKLVIFLNYLLAPQRTSIVNNSRLN